MLLLLCHGLLMPDLGCGTQEVYLTNWKAMLGDDDADSRTAGRRYQLQNHINGYMQSISGGRHW